MLMEAAHHSFLSVFRSVAAVTHQLRRLKHNWSTVFSAVALAKAVQRLKSLVLGLYSDESCAWEAGEAPHSSVPPSQGWILAGVAAVMLGVPFMAWKMLSTGSQGAT